ncbi:MAG: flagellar motor protein MotB [Planctomycetota bacterium]|jgi:flagellar motor protein MotB
MKFRKVLLILSLVATSLATSCTTRYQDMLKDRDDQIRSLNGDLARMRGENDELQGRLTAAPRPTEATTTRPEPSSLINDIQRDLGSDAVVSYRRGRISIGVNNRVTFSSGSTSLKNSSHQVLRGVAKVLKSQFSGRRFYVEGHTDTDPIRKTKDKYSSNRDLSMQRADSVAKYLISQGVPESAIVTVGFGQFDPLDRSKKAANRRVEIVVTDML